MSLIGTAFAEHLASGVTTLARLWRLTRRDGDVLGFTDHDQDLVLDGLRHLADHGMSAAALQSTTGLAVDNSEATGALSSEAIREADILAGLYDGAAVEIDLVNWQDLTQRLRLFRGSLGEVTRHGGAFRAELRSLAEALNQPAGEVWQRLCPAVLGDRRCGVDLSAADWRLELPLAGIAPVGALLTDQMPDYAAGWFAGGRLTVLSGAASGQSGLIRSDVFLAGQRQLTLWAGLRQMPAAGDLLRLEAGCDKRLETCRVKFGNLLNYRGFPYIPGEDWLSAVPANQAVKDGRSLWRL